VLSLPAERYLTAYLAAYLLTYRLTYLPAYMPTYLPTYSLLAYSLVISKLLSSSAPPRANVVCNSILDPINPNLRYVTIVHSLHTLFHHSAWNACVDRGNKNRHLRKLAWLSVGHPSITTWEREGEAEAEEEEEEARRGVEDRG
jgi:hypothetical protein